MEYLDAVLIKLKRKYSKDEVVAALTKKLSEAEIRNGVLVDEMQELKNELRNLRLEVNDKKSWAKEAKMETKKESMYQSQLRKIEALKNKLKQCYEVRNKLLSQIHKQNPA